VQLKRSVQFHYLQCTWLIAFMAPLQMPAIRTNDSTSDTTSSQTNARRSARIRNRKPYQSPSSDEFETEIIFQRHGRRRGGNSVTLNSQTTSRLESVSAITFRNSSCGITCTGPIIISGVHLRPTVAFDTFWRFAAERKAIDDRRRAGKPAPYVIHVFVT